MSNRISVEIIATKILEIRGKKVMLDRDLAELYHVETRVLNQAVRRNIARFPEDFMFSLTRKEIKKISQIVISLKYSKSVYAFTEQGVAMLSSVLNSKRAIKVNIQIMRAFVKLKELFLTHKDLAAKLEALERKHVEHDDKIKAIFEAIKQLLEPKPVEKKRRIGFHLS
ncbi:MAG: ORF6N domain-containing protein [Candidatus Omnitrophica bacterium]|nr:ORF6N domain-containing protein [Candidatus Omnitrophota bacterium]